MEDDAFSRALELAIQGDFGPARASLLERDSPAARRLVQLLEQIEQRERERRSSMKKARHEMGNALSIAQSSIEGMLDGIVAVSNARLKRIREILASVSDSMYAATAENDDEPRS